MIYEVRLFLERYKYPAMLISVIRRSKIWNSIKDHHALKRANETREKFTLCYNSHKSMFEAAASILADEFSRQTLQTVISYRLSPSKEKLQAIVVSPMYFQREILSPVKDEVFVDGGAYTGDTIIGLEEFCGGGLLEKGICM